MRTNYKKCNRKTHYRVRRGIIVKYSTCARTMWRRRGGGRSAGRRELGAVGAGRGGARRRCGWRAVRSGGCLVWGLGLDFGRRGCPGVALHLGQGQAWAAQPCARSGCPACSRWARWAALWARLHLGAAIGQAVRVARLCAAVRGLQWARLNRLQLARGREYVCSAFKRLLDAFCGCGGVLVRVGTASGLEGKYGALTCERGRGCFWA